MTALYFILIDEKNYHQFNDSEDLQHYLKNCGQTKGVIYLGSLEGFEITWDLPSGIVRLNLVNDKPSITHFFQAEAIYLHLEPVALAIRCLCKITLLHRLQEINDASILSIIQKIIDPTTGKINPDIHEAQLDATLALIYDSVTPVEKRKKHLFNLFFENPKNEKRQPIHESIYQAFLKFESGRKKIQHISSLKEVDDVLAKINVAKMKLVI